MREENRRRERGKGQEMALKEKRKEEIKEGRGIKERREQEKGRKGCRRKKRGEGRGNEKEGQDMSRKKREE